MSEAKDLKWRDFTKREMSTMGFTCFRPNQAKHLKRNGPTNHRQLISAEEFQLCIKEPTCDKIESRRVYFGFGFPMLIKKNLNHVSYDTWINHLGVNCPQSKLMNLAIRKKEKFTMKSKGKENLTSI